MKRMPTVLLLIFLVVAGCKKSDNNAAGSAGSWTFDNNTFNGINCTGNQSAATLTAINTVGGSTYSSLIVTFPDSLPKDSGTYIVSYAGSPPTAKHVTINVEYSTADTLVYYASTGEKSSKLQSVSVTMLNGKVGVSGTGIEIMNDTGLSDSTTLTFSIRQTQ